MVACGQDDSNAMGADSGLGGPQCADELDNDNDGLVDLADPGCENATDDDESNSLLLPECGDGIDNDDDGLIDDADPGCENSNGDNEFDDPVTTQCDDMVDNDGDGDIDLTEAAPIAEIMTSQTKRLSLNAMGIDNDDDGYIDFPDDPGCGSNRWR